ncbi:Outer membrane lipoprotein omp16 precursor [Candidatus Rhodobacter oscarellae]|uniref:Outer membrane lipoprotein omp16 n=1 Tax=Candidatus Rhodobacter oscarellae TaxID=1675527 RepID=A0A0J9E0S3_9RHOB|nr:OmpA family protein [Candidatus Rhodobacter lobularis]KMW56262.1 Outer membrane lipoprotein omp16 precursor [Candidatus Rhodobacter lobularis]
MRLSNYVPAIAVFLGAALLCIAAAMLAVAQIERSSQAAVKRVLMLDGQDWVSVAVDGLQVKLRGTAEDEATRFRAERLASTVVDADRVIDAMDVKAVAAITPPRFAIEFLRNDAGVSLIGLIPGAMDRQATAAQISEIAQGAPVTDLLESADFPVPPGWASALGFALDTLGRLPRSKISVAADRVEITSVAESAAAKRQLENSLKSAVPDGVNLVLRISAPRPVISPFTLRFVIDEAGARFDACTAHTKAGSARILAAAAEAGLQGEAACVLGLGVPTPEWPDAVTTGIGALARIGGGALTFSDADVSLVALESTDSALFDRVVGELENALPDVFSLSATKPEPVVIVGTGEAPDSGPPEFVATLSPEGLLQLRGRISDERLRAAVTGFARARFSTAEVSGTMRLDDRLPDGWAARVFAGLEALAMLSNGSLVVQPDIVDIRGATGNIAARAEVSRILSSQLGEAENFSIDIAYVEALDPNAALPSPQECVDAINAILAAQKVTFEPGSADIDAEEAGTIDRIAEVMGDCADVPMEIAGHTDSQGRETMNQALSQQRAQAVLVALQSRRVSTRNLSPQGYGEANPIADNGTEEGREENRRIEFTLIILGDPEGLNDPDAEPETDGAQPGPEAETQTETGAETGTENGAETGTETPAAEETNE